jgi:Spy/CpxP family protein refolding chaperone
MKAWATIIFLVTVLIFVVSAKTGTAQTNPDAENKQDAAHTLSEAQKQAIKRIRVESEKKAAPAALRFAGIVNKIYENMLSDKPDEELRARLSAEMKETAGELLTIKGQSIRETVNVLTPEQKQLIKSERLKPGAPADLSEVIAHTFNLTDK